ncbi:MAG: hypothetical protein SPE59_07675 [Treponema sp.]|nr:hypothetical protein [Treponema sp.]
MKKKICILLSLFLISVNLFSKEKVSFNFALETFLDLRVQLTGYEDRNKASDYLHSYWSDFWQKNELDSDSDQEKIILDNLFILEEYNYMWDNKANDDYFVSGFQKQIDISESYIAGHSSVSSWLFSTTADLFSCIMTYNPVSGTIKYGLKIKEYYEKALNLDSKDAYALTHYAQWFYWAPAVSGGGKNKALKTLETALEISKKPCDVFYAEMFISQVLFDMKKYEESSVHLNNALKVYPESYYIKFLADINKQGYSMFVYNRKMSDSKNNIKQ